jgi:WS/DGAT/MGAT family acyltransferase
MDGAGALRMVREMFSQSPTARWDAGFGQAKSEHASHAGIGQRLGSLTAGILEQGRALPELYGLLGNMGVRSWREGDAAPPLPFTGTRTLFNQDISGERCIIITRLSLKSVRKIGTAHGGTINDAILAICGGALRSYLQEQDALPDKSLFAGVPVSVDPSGEHKGNQLSTIICPLGTNFADPKERIERIVHITRQAKSDLHHVTRAASQNYMNLLLIPSMMLTLAGAASRVPPALNLILSNVPGPERPLYLNGSPVEAIYPLSLISDGGGVNITALSYAKELCVGIVACPTILPDIERLAEHIKQAHRELEALC